jgi:long-subunit acyl-CoA synthetase (AMP-forming)
VSFLLDVLRERARRAPHSAALEDANGRVMSCTELVAALESQGVVLRAKLPDRDRPVALLADRSIELCVMDLALMEGGVPVLSLPLFFTASQRGHALAQSGAQMIVRDAGGPGRALSCEVLQASGGPEGVACAAPAIPAGTARISYTSGSTGAAKGICLSAGNLLAVARGVVDAAGTANVGRHLAVLPPGVLLEEVAGCHASLLAGATYIAASMEEVGLAAPFQPDFARMATTIESTRATSLILVPEYLAGLVTYLAHTGRRLPALTLVAVGGARVAPALLERAREVGLPVRQGYGMTECGSVVSLHDGTAATAGSAGKSLGAHALSIAPDGEILVEGPKYLGCIGAPLSPEELRGTHRTGDIGRIDTEGRLWIEGRKSNLIITSFGRNVSPEWIESLLLEQPAIAQAMVCGDGAASLSALIVPRGPVEARDIDAALAAVNASLPDYARIRHWRRAQPFMPANGQLTGNGRLRRAQILAQYPMEEPADAVL